MFDVFVMFGAGVIGYIMLRNDFPTSPVALALLLGTNMEKSMSLTRTMYEGELYMVFSRPLAAALAAFTVFSFVFPLVKMARERKKKEAQGTGQRGE